MSALEALHERLAELVDLTSLGRLTGWDQRTMMPPERRAGPRASAGDPGAPRARRARQATTSARGWTRSRATARLSDVDRDVVRLARRDFDRQRRVPADLAAERAQASAQGQEIWQTLARARDFADVRARAGAQRRAGARPMRRAWTDGGRSLRRACWATTTTGSRPRACARSSERSSDALPALVAEAAARPAAPDLEVPVAAQKAAVEGVLRRRRRARATSWRVDVSAHPFSASMARRHARDDALRGRPASSRCWPRCTSSATRCTSARSRPSWRARTSARAPRCPCTSPRASCGRTTSRAIGRSPA